MPHRVSGGKSIVQVPQLNGWGPRIRIVVWERPNAGTSSGCTQDLRSWRYRCTPFLRPPGTYKFPRTRCVPGSPDDRSRYGPAQAVAPSRLSNSRIHRTPGCRSATSPKRMSWTRYGVSTKSSCRRFVEPSITSASTSGVRILWFITRCSRTASTCSLKLRASRM